MRRMNAVDARQWRALNLQKKNKKQNKWSDINLTYNNCGGMEQ
jgi:hypothetical protein